MHEARVAAEARADVEDGGGFAGPWTSTTSIIGRRGPGGLGNPHVRCDSHLPGSGETARDEVGLA